MLSPRGALARRALAPLLALTAWLSAAPVYTQPQYEVFRVVDGDTVVLRDIGTVRLIGVDTPETQDPREPVQHYGVEATAFLRSLVTGKTVRVDYDQQRIDKYRRTLAYLYLADGTFVNREIVRQGFGHAYLTYPFKYAEDFRAVEREAREAERGLWGTVPIQAPAKTDADRVWVNSSSGVYHCPGTRYYGNTSRGAYMTEAEARQAGHRPAFGRVCSPTVTDNAPAAAIPPAQILVGSDASPPAASAGARVWVNTSSRVYHCPGTRYYGNTASGEHLSEADAESRGHRPAGGKRCSGTSAAVTVAPQTALSTTPPAAPATADVRVWVNTSSRVYHCAGTRYYGTTKNGVYMGQREAQSQGHRPAAGRVCS